MNSRPPHFTDLNRRYREADWIKEFQGLWAIFNFWYAKQFPARNERDSIDALKVDSEFQRWVDVVLQSSTGTRVTLPTDGIAESTALFLRDNAISLFIRAMRESGTMAPRLSTPLSAGSERRVRATSAITLDSSQFLKAYRAHEALLSTDEWYATPSFKLNQTLSVLNVQASGCCFYRTASTSLTETYPAHLHFARAVVVEFRKHRELADLEILIELPEPTTLTYDIMEHLYNLRNAAVHGNLDMLIRADNSVARAAYDCLDSLIRFIREDWNV